jgi:hypothetical protein
MAKPKGNKKKTKDSNTTQKAGSRNKRQAISDDDDQSYCFLLSYHYHHCFLMMHFHPSCSPTPPSPSADPDTFLEECMREQLVELSTRDIEPTTSTATSWAFLGLGRAGASQHLAPEFSILPQVFNKPPSSAPFPTPAATMVAGGVTPSVSPCDDPLGVKPVGHRTIPRNLELSIFDILNIFHHRWFLSVDHLRANALLAQKAESGKFFWVEFAPHFHSHLVKCTVALVPHPLLKVKKVMFVFILELLNQEGHQAFFDLAKGTRIATQAQKEKKCLA